MKSKKCGTCLKIFHPFNSMAKACSVECSIKLVRKKVDKKNERDQKQKEKEFKRRTRQLKEKIKSKSDWAKEAQTAFNAYIRERDKLEPCISCQRHHGGQYHAGHYKSVGAHPELRYEELNCFKQCAPCNNHLSGNITNYRIHLINKIGLEKVEWLEGSHELNKYTIDDLKEIKQKYKNKLKELKQ